MFKSLNSSITVLTLMLPYPYVSAVEMGIGKFYDHKQSSYQRGVTTGKYIQPMISSDSEVLFSDTRLKLADNDNMEVNIGSAYRKQLGNNSFWGVYNFFDYMTQGEVARENSEYSQLTFGGEFFTSGKIVRANMYLPISEHAVATDTKYYSTQDGTMYKVDLVNSAQAGWDMSLGLVTRKVSANLGVQYYPDQQSSSASMLGKKVAFNVRPFDSGVARNIELNSEVSVMNDEAVNFRLGANYKISGGSRPSGVSQLAYIVPVERDVDVVLKQTVKIGVSPAGEYGQGNDVVHYYNGMKGGYFLDIGAHDGHTTSNTKGLEQSLDWTGMCVEAAPAMFELLTESRPACNNQQYALSDIDGKEVTFTISKNHFISGITDSLGKWKDVAMSDSEQVLMVTKSLQSLLKEQGAPKRIDYMSLDIEGEELNVLKGVDLNEYWIEFIDLEHNFEEPRRTDIHDYLLSQGYYFLAENNVDDYYIRPYHEGFSR